MLAERLRHVLTIVMDEVQFVQLYWCWCEPKNDYLTVWLKHSTEQPSDPCGLKSLFEPFVLTCIPQARAAFAMSELGFVTQKDTQFFAKINTKDLGKQ